jgi:hypothetical protein
MSEWELFAHGHVHVHEYCAFIFLAIQALTANIYPSERVDFRSNREILSHENVCVCVT